MSGTEWGIGSLIPLVITLLLAFATRSALVAMIAGTFVGTLMLGVTPGVGMNELLQRALGNGDFIWICEIVILIGILFEMLKQSGVLAALAARFASAGGSRRRVELATWGMGFVIVDDYFSPLLTGAVMRPISDRVAIPREKLAFLLDSTTACVCILVPFTAWGAYVASLIAAQSDAVEDAAEGLTVFIAAIPYNFYPMLMLVLALLVAARIVPDFGPMRRAERRVRETGALIRPGGKPLLSDEDDDVTQTGGHDASIVAELIVPVLLLVGMGAFTLIAYGSVKIVEAFMLADVWLLAVFAVRRRFRSVGDVGELVIAGTRSVMPALLIVAFAYALNAVTTELGAGAWVVAEFASAISPNSLVVITFLLTSTIAFSTGTSWGAYALMMPVALPFALEFAGGEPGPLVYQTVAAIAGGGIFGDHASPVSDTTVLSSVGAGSDHIDHVVTQLPYALVVAALTAGIYAWI